MTLQTNDLKKHEAPLHVRRAGKVARWIVYVLPMTIYAMVVIYKLNTQKIL